MMQKSKKKQQVNRSKKTEHHLEERRRVTEAVEEIVMVDLSNLHKDVEGLRCLVEEKTEMILQLQEQIYAKQNIDGYEKYIRENGGKIVEEIINLKPGLEKLGDNDLIKDCDNLLGALEAEGGRFLLHIREITSINEQEKFMQEVWHYFVEKTESLNQITKIFQRRFAIWATSEMRKATTEFKYEIAKSAMTMRKQAELVQAFHLLGKIDELMSYSEDSEIRLSISFTSFNRRLTTFVLGDGQDLHEVQLLFEALEKYEKQVYDTAVPIMEEIKSIAITKEKTRKLLIKLADYIMLAGFVVVYIVNNYDRKILLPFNFVKLTSWLIIGIIAVGVTFLIYTFFSNEKYVNFSKKKSMMRRLFLFGQIRFLLYCLFYGLFIFLFPSWVYPLAQQVIKSVLQVNPENSAMVILGHVIIVTTLITPLVAVGIRVSKFLKKSI